MNRKDVKLLVEEWIRQPPGSRPLLDKAIAEQYRKALTCQWEGLKCDNLTQWLKEHMRGTRDLTDSQQDDLDNRVAAMLNANEPSTVLANTALPLAAFKPSEKHMHPTTVPIPSDNDIAAKVRTILDGLSSSRTKP